MSRVTSSIQNIGNYIKKFRVFWSEWSKNCKIFRCFVARFVEVVIRTFSQSIRLILKFARSVQFLLWFFSEWKNRENRENHGKCQKFEKILRKKKGSDRIDDRWRCVSLENNGSDLSENVWDQQFSWWESFCANLGPSFRPESVVCGTVGEALDGAPLALEEVPLGLEGTAPSLDFGTVFADLAVGGVAKEELPLAGLEENWPSDCLFSTLSGISSKSQEKLYSQDSSMLATFEIF